MAATPSPPEVHTPGAPLHGPMFDTSHISNRRSDRIKNQKRVQRTPSPGYNTSSFDSEAPGELKRTPKAKRPASCPSRSFSRHHLSPPSSPIDQDFNKASAGYFDPAIKLTKGMRPHSSAVLASLPTPMKTPRKQANHLNNSTQAARVLFSQDLQPHREPHESSTPSSHMHTNFLPTPMSKKRGKRIRKAVGFSLDSEFERATGGQDESIEIYTDSHEMIPERDDSVDNPFYVRPGAPKKKYTKRAVKPAQAKNVERGIELLKNNRGYFAIGRGRRYWKAIEQDAGDGPISPSEKYGEHLSCEDGMEEDGTNGLYAVVDSDDTRFTRRSLRPRRLFAPDLNETTMSYGQLGDSDANDDAEATTDIEDPEKHGFLPLVDDHDCNADTAYPLHKTTVGGSVSDQHAQSVAPIALTGATEKPVDISVSPFDSWPRRKTSRARSSNINEKTSPATTAAKREGETIGSAAKRVRESS